MGQKAAKNMLPMQAGDVVATCADIADLNNAVGFTPSTNLSDGVAKFVDWFQELLSCLMFCFNEFRV